MPSIAFPNLAAAGQQRLVFDGSCARVRINDTDVSGFIKSIAYGVTVEGKEHQYGLGDVEAFAKTTGVIKPGEVTLSVYADKANDLLSTISLAGLHFQDSASITITESVSSSGGLAALAAEALGNVRSIAAVGCDLTGLSATIETGGAAIMEEMKFLPLRYLFNGKPGVAGLLNT